jgi:hypothetical protein
MWKDFLLVGRRFTGPVQLALTWKDFMLLARSRGHGLAGSPGKNP